VFKGILLVGNTPILRDIHFRGHTPRLEDALVVRDMLTAKLRKGIRLYPITIRGL